MKCVRKYILHTQGTQGTEVGGWGLIMGLVVLFSSFSSFFHIQKYYDRSIKYHKHIYTLVYTKRVK